MDNNKGVSFVEIIIVIAILSVLGVSAFGGIRYINYGNKKNCAYTINAALDKIRLENMSKAEKASLYIYRSGNGYFMRVSAAVPMDAHLDDTGSQLGNDRFVISYETTARPGTKVEVGDYASGKYLKLSFDKGTGELNSNGTDYYNNIYISDRDGTVQYTIRLIQASGKHFVQ